MKNYNTFIKENQYNIKDINEDLIESCQYADDVKKVKKLIDNGANINFIGVSENTPLTTAVQFGSINVLRELLKHKDLDLELKGTIEPDSLSGRDTPPIVIAGCGDITIIELLLDAGANIDGVGHDGMTALFFASLYRMMDNLIYLIKKGANMHIEDKYGDNFEYNLGDDDIDRIKQECEEEYLQYKLEQEINKYNL